MSSKELNRAAQEIRDRHKQAQQNDFQELVEKVRVYPNGFEFTRKRCGNVERLQISSAFISGVDTLDAQIYYRCKVLTWSSWSEYSTPISESEISANIKNFGTTV